MTSRSFSRRRRRSSREACFHAGKAFRARATASWTCASVVIGNSPSASPVAGSNFLIMAKLRAGERFVMGGVYHGVKMLTSAGMRRTEGTLTAVRSVGSHRAVSCRADTPLQRYLDVREVAPSDPWSDARGRVHALGNGRGSAAPPLRRVWRDLPPGE